MKKVKKTSEASVVFTAPSPIPESPVKWGDRCTTPNGLIMFYLVFVFAAALVAGGALHDAFTTDVSEMENKTATYTIPLEATLGVLTEPPPVPECTLSASDPSHEAATARIMWWLVERGFAVKVKRTGFDETWGYASAAAKEVFLDPCRSSAARLATMLHEIAHVLQPWGAFEPGAPAAQVFADAVARRVWVDAGLVGEPSLPVRDYGELIGRTEAMWRQQIEDAAKVLTRVVK